MRGLWPLVSGGAGSASSSGSSCGWGAQAFVDGLRGDRRRALLAALALGLLTTVASAWRWCLVARGLGLRLPLAPRRRDYYRALFLNAVLPAGVLGDVHRAVGTAAGSGDVGRGVRAVVLERVAGQVVLVVVGLAVLLTARPTPADGAAPGTARRRRAARRASSRSPRRCCGWPAPRRTARLRAALRSACVDARPGSCPGRHGRACWRCRWSTLAGYLALFVVAARVAGSQAPLADLLPLLVLGLLAMALPLNIGGWGPREGVMAVAFGAAGLGAAQGLTTAVVYGVLSLIACLPGAVVLLLSASARRVPAPAILERSPA